MIRPCPNCSAPEAPPWERVKMRVDSAWNRKDGVVGRRLRCPECGLIRRSYEFIGHKKLGHQPGDPRQLRLL